MVQRPVLHPMAIAQLTELRERWGIEPAAEEVLWIVEACRRVAQPTDSVGALCGFPRRVGNSNAWLWPLTIGACVWLQEYAYTWWRDQDEQETLALVFAHAHARRAEVFRELLVESAAKSRVFTWALGLGLCWSEMHAALDELHPAPPPADKKREPPGGEGDPDWLTLVLDIEAATGIHADTWLWERSVADTLATWQQARAQIQAQAGVAAKRGALDPLNKALRDLAFVKSEIIKAHGKTL